MASPHCHGPPEPSYWAGTRAGTVVELTEFFGVRRFSSLPRSSGTIALRGNKSGNGSWIDVNFVVKMTIDLSAIRELELGPPSLIWRNFRPAVDLTGFQQRQRWDAKDLSGFCGTVATSTQTSRGSWFDVISAATRVNVDVSASCFGVVSIWRNFRWFVVFSLCHDVGR